MLTLIYAMITVDHRLHSTIQT